MGIGLSTNVKYVYLFVVVIGGILEQGMLKGVIFL